MKLHCGDSVIVISGKDKGKTGKILKVLSTGRVVVSDINMRTKHIKSQPNRSGQIIRYEASIDSSNVMIIDLKTNKRSRIGYDRDDKGGKKRIAKRSGEVIIAGKVPEKRNETLIEEKNDKQKNIIKDDKSEKNKSLKDVKKSDRVKSPEKKPFWKGLSFGAEALEEDAISDGPQTKKDHTVPDQSKTTDTFTHKRGG